MARILAYTSPARGHLFPVMPIALDLRARGHDVAIRTLAAEVPAVRAAGVRAAPIAADVEAIAMDDHLARTPRGRLARSVRVFVRRAAHDGPDLAAAVADERPDALLVDVNAWGALAAAEASGLPWAAYCPYPVPIPGGGAPPFGPGLAPARGPLGRARDRVVAPLVTRAIAGQMVPGLNDVRARTDPRLRPLVAPHEAFTRAGRLILTTAEPFEYARTAWPPGTVLVGPLDWDRPAPLPDWLDDGDDRPLVLVTTSSEPQADDRLVRTALRALTADGHRLVVTMPGGAPADLRVPPGAIVEGFVAHGPLLARAACAVTHGGMGATQKALARGVPVCAVPFGRDQMEVARRVQVAGAGTRLPASRLNARRLRAQVARAMRMTAGAQAVAAGFTAGGGARRAATAVEDVLREG